MSAGEDSLQKGQAVMVVNLVESLGPAKSLIPGLLEGHRLLVVDHGLFTVADHLALKGAVDGELNILREQMEWPSAVFPDQIPGYQKSRPGDGAAGADSHSGGV